MAEQDIMVLDDEPTERPSMDLTVCRAPELVLEEAHRAAKALKDVISTKDKPVKFGGEQYLEFEDWQTVGKFYAITAKEDGDPEYVELGGIHGFKASGVALWNGKVISRATAFCMSDEPNWRNKPLFQLSSMAQTRANAKVLRNVLSWVVVLAGYRPTPAEEMDGVISGEARVAPAKQIEQSRDGAPILTFGKHSGKALDDPNLPTDYLQWLEDSLEEQIKDPKKAKWADEKRELKQAVYEEINRRTAQA